MELSIFLAKFVGLYLLILGILGIFRHKEFKLLGKDIAASKAALAISGEISLLFGLALVIDHSVWENSWRVIITIFGYLMLLKGIMRFAFPARVQKMLMGMSDRGVTICSFVMLIVGIYLTYCGFSQ
jgi:hypothetical protein